MTGTRAIGWAALLAAVAALVAVTLWIARPHVPQRRADAAATFIDATLVESPGPVVTSLRSGGKGEAAGLRVGDRVEAVNGRSSPSLRALAKDLRLARRGPMDIRVRRGEGVWHAVVVKRSGEQGDEQQDLGHRGRRGHG